MAYLDLSEISSTSVLCHVCGLDTSYSRTDRSIDWYCPEGELYRTDALPAGVSESGGCRIRSLKAETDYTVVAVIHYTNSGVWETKTLSSSFRTESKDVNPRPEYFEWDTSKQKGKTINITAAEWTALQDNINAVREWCGETVFRFSTVHRGDTITADLYNDCIYAIKTVNKNVSLKDYVDKGDTITADCINYLKDAINEV